MQYDITVIGGGPGGYVAAIKAAQMGAKVCLIEKSSLGGTCLNRGCIPTKALLKCSQTYDAVQNARKFGIEGIDKERITVNIEKIIERKDGIVNRLKSGIDYLLKVNKVELVSGSAEVLDRKHVKVGDREIGTKTLIIATGSETAIVPIDGVKEGMQSGFVITSNEALDMKKLPRNLCIIGGGVIGVELATFFNIVGVKVTIVELMPEILPTVDEEIVASLREHLISKGIRIYTGAKAKRIKKSSIVIAHQSSEMEIDADSIILAVGRVPDTKGFEKLNLEFNRNAIKVNEKMETSIPGVYAIGDVNGMFQLAHVASVEGIVAVENALGGNAKMSYNSIPQCIYTSPQIASVGLTEKMAKEKGYSVKVGKFPMAANSKASVEEKSEGFAKVICDSVYGEILGIHLYGENVTEMIVGGVLSINLEATIEDLAMAISPHPSISEAITEAAHAAIHKAIHMA